MINYLYRIKKRLFDKESVKDLHGFEYTVNELVGIWESSREALKWHGQLLDNSILKYKTSNTIFLLGSGPSINDISKKEWKYINQHDSIGFNWWFVHDFVPTFYMFQAAKDNMLEVLKDKFEQYENVPFLIRGSDFGQGRFDFDDYRLNLLKNNPVYYVGEYPIAGRCSIEPVSLFKYVEALGLMSFGTISKFVPKWRSTLGLLISLSYQMGYKNIILCGMDMQNNQHFWDSQYYKQLQAKYALPEGGPILKFLDTSFSSNTLPKYVYSLREWMKSKEGVEMYVVNERTVLYPEIPKFTWEGDL